MGDRRRTIEIEGERESNRGRKEWDGIEEEAVGKGGRKSGIEREIKKVKHHQRYLQ